MRVRDAANIGRVMIIVHLIMSVCLSMVSLLRTVSAVAQGGGALQYLATSFMYLLATVILDIALLIVFSYLARTQEHLLRDRPDE